MWDYVGIVRTNKRLLRAKHRDAFAARGIHEFYANYRVSHNLLELRNLVDVADVIIRAAPCCAKRAEGLHFSRDYPQTLPRLDTVMTPKYLKELGEL